MIYENDLYRYYADLEIKLDIKELKVPTLTSKHPDLGNVFEVNNWQVRMTKEKLYLQGIWENYIRDHDGWVEWGFWTAEGGNPLRSGHIPTGGRDRSQAPVQLNEIIDVSPTEFALAYKMKLQVQHSRVNYRPTDPFPVPPF